MTRMMLAAMIACLPTLVQAQEARVFAVNQVLADFAAALGGDAVEVAFPVPEGSDPALWRPSIAEIGAIQSADVILLNGAAYAAWTTKTSLPRAKLVDTSAAFADAYIETESGMTHSHGNEGEHSHVGIAPMTWLDFSQAAAQAEAAAAGLARALPGRAETVAQASSDLQARLLALHERARALGAALDGRPVVASHPGLEYFARAYGLNLRSVSWPAGEIPGEAGIAALSDLLRSHPAATMIWLGAPTPEARAAAEGLGLTGAVFDTGDTPGSEGFLARMEANLAALEALAGG